MVQFASYLRRVLCKTRLIFPRINGPNDNDNENENSYLEDPRRWLQKPILKTDIPPPPFNLLFIKISRLLVVAFNRRNLVFMPRGCQPGCFGMSELKKENTAHREQSSRITD